MVHFRRTSDTPGDAKDAAQNATPPALTRTESPTDALANGANLNLEGHFLPIARLRLRPLVLLQLLQPATAVVATADAHSFSSFCHCCLMPDALNSSVWSLWL